MRSAQSIVSELFPDREIRHAAFGSLDMQGTSTSSLGTDVSLNLDNVVAELAGKTNGEAASSIVAVDARQVHLIQLGVDPGVMAFAIYDLSAEHEQVSGTPSIRLRPNATLDRELGLEFGASFELADNTPWSSAGLAQNLATAINMAGDPLRSSHPLLRFIARSIQAVQTGNPDFVLEVVSKETYSKVRNSSLSGAMKKLIDEPGWLDTVVRALEAQRPEDDEIFLMAMPGKWILTDRRLYLLSDTGAVEAARLSEVKTCAWSGIFRKRVKVELESGEVILRDGPDFVPESDFERCVATLKSHGAF